MVTVVGFMSHVFYHNDKMKKTRDVGEENRVTGADGAGESTQAGGRDLAGPLSHPPWSGGTRIGGGGLPRLMPA